MSALRWIDPTPDGAELIVATDVYPVEVILRTCHAFTDRCYVFAQPETESTVRVHLAPRCEGDSLRDLAGTFSNALLDQRLRASIADETRVIRELLVAQAFCEADLLDRRAIDADEQSDPRGIRA